jgi:hypothetical protein
MAALFVDGGDGGKRRADGERSPGMRAAGSLLAAMFQVYGYK